MPAESIAWLRPGWDTCDIDKLLDEYRTRGFVHVPGVVSEVGLAAMRARADGLARGEVDHTPFFFQHDAASGRYEDMPLGEGWIGPSPRYRKIEKLERDERFRVWIGNPFFERIAKAVIGDEVALYRAILMTKAPAQGEAAGGTELPWHQDGGRLWGLSEDPELQIWTALDDCPLASGCMRMLVGSHQAGLATPLGGAVPAEVVQREEARYPIEDVPAQAGDVVILHNMLWHASGLNRTAHTRRAFSACYLPTRVTCMRKKKTKRSFPRIW